MRISDWSSDVCSSDLVLYYKKIIPNNIKDYLTPQAIAIWIMDDGSRQNSGITIHTNSFTLEENYLLQAAFLERYNIKTTLHKKGLNYIMYFRSEEHTSELQSLMRKSYAFFCLK